MPCESCISEISDEIEYPGLDETSQLNALVEWGDEIADHLCDEIETAGEVRCDCSCKPTAKASLRGPQYSMPASISGLLELIDVNGNRCEPESVYSWTDRGFLTLRAQAGDIRVQLSIPYGGSGGNGHIKILQAGTPVVDQTF